jgi:AAA domain
VIPRITAEVITGPAGTGKTTVLAALARAWDGPVVGTATSQNATNGLHHAGIGHAANATRPAHGAPGRGSRSRSGIARGVLMVLRSLEAHSSCRRSSRPRRRRRPWMGRPQTSGQS